MQMPPAEQRIIEQRKSLIIAFSKVVGSENVLEDETSLRTYDSDGLTAYKQLPMLVVLPANTAEVSAVMAICGERKVKIVPRGAGTSLSGGALPLADGVIIGTGRLNRILEVDFENRCAVVQPGVRNLAVSEAVDASGFFYAPDPSSQIICSVGGNVAENSGGVH
jgi:glycolate oxidase